MILINDNRSMIKDNLKLYRKLKNLSQEDLAKLLNVSHKTISHWENGYSEPSIAMIQKIKEIFNISYEELLD